MAKINTKTVWEFADALKQSFSTDSDTRAATVQSVDDDGTVWVVYPGASSPTPIASVGAAVEPGDYVYTQLLNGRLVLTTNKTDPASGVNRTRSIVQTITAPIQKAVVIAKGIADEAKAVANAINQHFWTDDNGAHVTDVTQDEWKAAVDDGFGDYDADTKPYHNLLMNSLGILLRTALNNLVSITRSAIAFYDGDGNDAANIVASFGKDGAQIGLTNESHVSIDYRSLQMVDKQGNTYFTAIDLRDANGVAQLYSGNIPLPKKQFNAGLPISGVLEVVIFSGNTGRTVPASGYTISGNIVTLTAETTENDTYWDMWYTTTSEDAKAYTLGQRMSRLARGASSVSEGYSDATGAFSHSEGFGTLAVAESSHAEGNRCRALGKYSHAQNSSTRALSDSQTTIGRFNAVDASDQYALIIGNGTGDANRSNALAVDWNGNLITQAMAGIIQMFAGATAPNGWLNCDGSAVSRTTYATLFAAIGTTWGAGDGSTTFNLPDLRGRAPIGAGTGSGLTARTLGDNGGAESVTLTAAQSGLPEHTHSISRTTNVAVSDSGHTHGSGDDGSFLVNPETVARRTVASGSGATNQLYSAGATSRKTATASGKAALSVTQPVFAVGTVTGGAAAASSAHENMQPFAVVGFIICTGKTD